jgi:ketosteroid isomerase-like protein
MIRHSSLAASALGFAVALVATPVAAQQQSDTALVTLVSDFVEAERQFDQKRLAALITDDYAEISPIGDLDLREEFLGFYAPAQKRPIPTTTMSSPVIRRYGDTASIITSLSFERPGAEGQPPRKVSIRVGFLAVRSAGSWKLASAQYTPERPAPPAPPAPPVPPAH